MINLNAIKLKLAALSRFRLVQFVSATWRSYRRTNCSQMAAGIGLFAMLSLLPLIVLMVSALASIVQLVSPDFDMRRSILHFAQITVSPVARAWLQDILQSLAKNSLVVDGFTFLAFVWAASNVFSQLDASFHRIWYEGTVGNVANFRGIVLEQFRRRRNAFLLLLLGLISFVMTSLTGRWTSELGLVRFSIEEFIANVVLTWLEGALFLILLYRWLLPERAKWRGVVVGAVAASGANLLVRTLVTSFVDTTIGATNANIGGPLALMLGVYLFIQNVLIGCILVRQHIWLDAKSNPG